MIRERTSHSPRAQCEYFYNEETGESTYERPAELLEGVDAYGSPVAEAQTWGEAGAEGAGEGGWDEQQGYGEGEVGAEETTWAQADEEAGGSQSQWIEVMGDEVRVCWW